jgi:hypothetical protein
MISKILALGTFALSLAGGWLAVTSTVAAQEPAVITVTAEARQRGIEEAFGFVDIYADGQLCGRLSFSNPDRPTPDGGAEFELSGPGQASTCSVFGAEISFSNGRGVPLLQTFRHDIGARLVLTSFETAPPSVVTDAVVVVRADRLGSLRHMPEGVIEILANGQLCGLLAAEDSQQRAADGGQEFRLGQVDQPDPCRTNGSRISLRRADGVQLRLYFTLSQGARFEITDFGPPPPATGAPGAPEPPASGLGLETTTERAAPAALAAGALLVVSLTLAFAALSRRWGRAR